MTPDAPGRTPPGRALARRARSSTFDSGSLTKSATPSFRSALSARSSLNSPTMITLRFRFRPRHCATSSANECKSAEPQQMIRTSLAATAVSCTGTVRHSIPVTELSTDMTSARTAASPPCCAMTQLNAFMVACAPSLPLPWASSLISAQRAVQVHRPRSFGGRKSFDRSSAIVRSDEMKFVGNAFMGAQTR